MQRQISQTGRSFNVRPRRMQYCYVIFSKRQSCTHRMNAARIAFFSSSQRDAHQQNSVQSTIFSPRGTNEYPAASRQAVSFCSKLRRKLRSPLLPDSLIICPVPARHYLSLSPSRLPIAGPSSSFQDDPLSDLRVLSVTYTCPIQDARLEMRMQVCDVDKNDDK